jgi:MerR family Zn(II)-responsive transcriptional regulator of zntA
MTKKMLFKIGEIAKKTGVTLRTIRYYDELGLIKPSKRSAGNFRLYDENAISIIKLISNLKKLDYTLEEIKNILVNRNCDEASYIATINHTKNVLLKKKNKVEEKLKHYQQLSGEIDKSIEIIEQCFECRKERGDEAPCKPGCENSNVHISI